MNTPSHWLMTAALAKAMPQRSIPRGAAGLGAIAPDVALWLLSVGGFLYYRTLRGWSAEAAFTRMFDELFFTHPLWVIPHNFLHAPIVLLVGVAIARFPGVRHHHPATARWVFWFLMACLLHSGVDILTHAGDGPLLFFPADWQTRFNSPISYWDERYYAATFQWFELGLDAACGLYLSGANVARWLRRCFSDD